MRWLAHTFLGLLCSACSTVTFAPSPALPIGEFYDQVLDPLAAKLADEHIDQSKAELKAGHLSPAVLTLLGSAFGPGGAAVGGGLAALGNASLDKQAAQIDAKRVPLKREFLALLTQRTVVKGTAYAVCVQGAERLYDVQGGRFVRLADGSGPCDVTTITSLMQH